MRKIDIVHVYPGTGGAAGMYVDEIYNSLRSRFSQICMVNFYYPFNYGDRVFYRFTEMVGTNIFRKYPKFRLWVRLFELMLGLFHTYVVIKIKSPKLVNYSMTSNLYIEYAFIKLVKLTSNSKIMITCHDVMPFETHYTDATTEVKKRLKFFELADFLLTHNENSKEDLVNIYSVNTNKIRIHDFPVMDLQNFCELSSIKEISVPLTTLNVLFVGHARIEKGLDVLLTAWGFGVPKNMNLTVACNIPLSAHYKFSELIGKNFTLIDKFLSDEEYAFLISQSDFVILPYTQGTNSGIPSSIISLGTIPVCSDISMFRNNDLLEENDLFIAGNPAALLEKLIDLSTLSSDQIKDRHLTLARRYNVYRAEFSVAIPNVYQEILGNLKL